MAGHPTTCCNWDWCFILLTQPKVSKLCISGAETGTGWRSSTTADRCLQACLMVALGKGRLFKEQLARSCAVKVPSQPQAA